LPRWFAGQLSALPARLNDLPWPWRRDLAVRRRAYADDGHNERRQPKELGPPAAIVGSQVGHPWPSPLLVLECVREKRIGDRLWSTRTRRNTRTGPLRQGDLGGIWAATGGRPIWWEAELFQVGDTGFEPVTSTL
jgi:hypothetical protein